MLSYRVIFNKQNVFAFLYLTLSGAFFFSFFIILVNFLAHGSSVLFLF